MLFGASPIGSGPFGKTSSYPVLHLTANQQLATASLVAGAFLGYISRFTSLNAQLQPAVLSATGYVPVTLGLSQTLQSCSSSSSLAVGVKATVNKALDNAALYALAAAAIVGGATQTLAPAALVARIGPIVKGTVTQTLQNVTVSSLAFIATIGFLEIQLQDAAGVATAFRRNRRTVSVVRTLRAA